jgi:hypothetical protein
MTCSTVTIRGLSEAPDSMITSSPHLKILLHSKEGILEIGIIRLILSIINSYQKYLVKLTSSGPIRKGQDVLLNPIKAPPNDHNRTYNLYYIYLNKANSFTYDHRLQRTRDPVRSPIFKL